MNVAASLLLSSILRLPTPAPAPAPAREPAHPLPSRPEAPLHSRDARTGLLLESPLLLGPLAADGLCSQNQNRYADLGRDPARDRVTLGEQQSSSPPQSRPHTLTDKVV